MVTHFKDNNTRHSNSNMALFFNSRCYRLVLSVIVVLCTNVGASSSNEFDFHQESSEMYPQVDSSDETTTRNIAISCWSDPCAGIIGQAGAAILEDRGYTITNLNVNVREVSLQDLIDRLKDQDAVFWWNWDLPISPDEILLLRQALPKHQIWMLFNWDDPHSWGENAPPERREMISKLALQLDIVYTTGSSTITTYLASGAKKAIFVMVPYSDLYHHFDPDPNFECDVNFVATNYYDDFKGLASSRRVIVEALAAAPDINTAIYGLDSGNSKKTDAFKVPVRFEDNRKVFSSCKLTLNLLVAAVNECSDGHVYANERVPTAMASGAIQLVEDHYCYNGLLENGKTAVFLHSTEPEEVVSQVREIINKFNYPKYEHIRETAILSAQKWHISSFIQMVDKDIEDHRSLTQTTPSSQTTRVMRKEGMRKEPLKRPKPSKKPKPTKTPKPTMEPTPSGNNSTEPDRLLFGPMESEVMPKKAGSRKLQQQSIDYILSHKPERTKSIAIVTMMGETNHMAYQSFDVYQKLGVMTLQSILEYGSQWGCPVFFMNDFLMDKSRQAYWSKINIIRYYLGMFDYVLYTDIDVLFTNPKSMRLEDFIVDGFDLIGVNECKDRVNTNDVIRSGFMMFCNSPGSHKFLDAWESMFLAFEHVENPEQSALELLVQKDEFKNQVMLHNWASFHSYDTCSGGEAAFSMHFPGAFKVERVARIVAWFEMSKYGFSREKPLAQLLGFESLSIADISHGIIQNGLISVQKIPLTMPDQFDIQGAVESLREISYNVFTNKTPLQLLQEEVWRYKETSFYWAIPNVVYFTVKDKTLLHPDIQERLVKWRHMNPGYEIIVHDDDQMNDLVLSLLPSIEEQWHALEPVQRVDIYRYVLIHSFGGWFFDIDVDAIRSIANWGHESHHTLVVGVEADNYAEGAPHYEGARPLMFSQYSFGAAPQHPAIKWVLDKIVSLAEQGEIRMIEGMISEERLLHVLTTTGPVVWTDSIVEYLTLSASVWARSHNLLSSSIWEVATRMPRFSQLLVSVVANSTPTRLHVIKRM